MEAGLRQKYVKIATELRKYLNSEEFRTHKPEHAFIQWYILARFGKLSQNDIRITDGANDGGIDAIVNQHSKTLVFQMKYEERPRVTSVARDELGGYEKVANIFTEKDSAAFESWLNTVRADLRQHYLKVRRQAQKDPSGVLFVFVTTKYVSYPSHTVEIEDVRRVLSLWDLYREGFTPPTDSIEIKLKDPFNVEQEDGSFITYVGLADVQDFLKLMQDDTNERLFAQNVRTDLHSSINGEIKETYENDPHSFWLGNNGIYIVCKEVKRSGNRFTLIYPSIINGSQTLHSIARSSLRHSCVILVRVLEMDVVGNPRLLSEVIRRTNTQNAMKPVNLLAHDQYHLNIARYLDAFRIFYERRQGEWQTEKKDLYRGYLKFTIQQLGQWLSTTDPNIGLGRARSRTGDLFKGNYYGKIFGSFDRDLNNSSYKDLVFAVWAGFFVEQLVSKTPKAQRAFTKIPHLLIIRGLYETISSSAQLQNEIRSALEFHKIGKRNLPPAIQSHIKNVVVRKFRKIQKKYQKRNPLTDYSNYFKVDKLTTVAYEAVFTSKEKRFLVKLLLKQMSKIK